MSKHSDSNYNTISPKGNTLAQSIKELMDYRYLIKLLIRRDLVASFKQSILGPIWFIVQPIMLTLVYTVVFGIIAKMPTDGVPSFIYFFSGLIIWNGFLAVLNRTSQTFLENIGIFGKVHVPRLAPSIATSVSNTLIVFIQLVVLLIAAIYYHFNGYPMVFSYRMVFGILLIFLAIIMAFGFGLVVAALTVRFRDLIHALPFITALWMYMSPIIYSFEAVPENILRILWINPMSGVVVNFRYFFLGIAKIYVGPLIYSIIFTIAVLFVGLKMFNSAQKNFVDTI